MTTQPAAAGATKSDTPGADGDRGESPTGCGGAAPLGPGAREFLKALASEQRQQMLELFTGGVEITVGAVAERLAISQPAASQQLAILRRGGLLTSRKVGKQVHYRIDSAAVDASLTELRTYLHACCPPPETAEDQ